jgi:hypothetical protein
MNAPLLLSPLSRPPGHFVPGVAAGEGWGEGLADSGVDPLTPALPPLQGARENRRR